MAKRILAMVTLKEASKQQKTTGGSNEGRESEIGWTSCGELAIFLPSVYMFLSRNTIFIGGVAATMLGPFSIRERVSERRCQFLEAGHV